MRPFPDSSPSICRLAFAFVLSLSCSCRVLLAQSNSNSADLASLSAQANAARDSNHLDEAVALYKKALGLNPQWAEGWFNLGTVAYARNDYAGAARAFRRVLPLAPKEGSAYAFLGLCEYELGEYDNALKHIEEASALGIAKNPQFRQVVLYHEGLLNLRKSRFRAASEALSQLCRDNQYDPQTTMAMGMAALRIPGTSLPAKGSLESIVVPRVGHAACLAAAQKYDDARPEFAAVVNDYPKFPNIHFAYGKFLAETNEIGPAVAQFELEVQNNPQDVYSRLEIAATDYKVDSAAGIPYAERALQLAPQVMFAHYLLGLLYLDTGDFQKAIPHLELAAKAFPKAPDIYFALSSALAKAGRKQESQEALRTYQRLKQETNEDVKASY